MIDLKVCMYYLIKKLNILKFSLSLVKINMYKYI